MKGNKRVNQKKSRHRDNLEKYKRRKKSMKNEKKHSDLLEKAERRKNKQIDVPEESMENFINLNAVKSPLTCKVCTKSFSAHMDLGLHSIVHSEEGKFSCHLCEYKKATKKTFKSHIKSHDMFQCQKCNRIFKFRRSAYKHSKSHPADYVECEICGKKLKPECLKNHHKNVHSEKKFESTFQCQICNKVYLCHTSLRNHYSHNHRELGIDVSVVCDVCGKRLSCKSKFIQHLRTHTGEKPFGCTVCTRSFSTKDILVSHMRVHTGEKPYVCRYCGKKFAHDGPYRYHIKTHTGEKLHNCPICKKGFISKANMRIHIKSCTLPIK